MAQQATSSPQTAQLATRPPLRTRLVRGINGYLFILPTFLFLGYFLYYPAWTALSGAFTDWDGFNPPQFVGLQNFERAFADPALRASIWNNVVWAMLRVVRQIVPPFLVAELIFHLAGRRQKYFYRTLFVIPLVIPGIVEILLWKYFYRTDGLLNQGLALFGIGELRWLSDPGLALYSLIFMGFPWIAAFNLLIYYSGLQNISKEVLEAAALDGTTGWRRIWSIDIPLTLPQTKLLLILAIISSVQVILEPLVMTGGGPGFATYMPGLHMYLVATQYGEFGYSMAIALLMFLVVLVLTVVNMRFFQERAD